MRYEIDELFDVLVGGVPDETPMYIRLRNQNINAWVDLREDGVEQAVISNPVFLIERPPVTGNFMGIASRQRCARECLQCDEADRKGDWVAH